MLFLPEGKQSREYLALNEWWLVALHTRIQRIAQWLYKHDYMRPANLDTLAAALTNRIKWLWIAVHRTENTIAELRAKNCFWLADEFGWELHDFIKSEYPEITDNTRRHAHPMRRIYNNQVTYVLPEIFSFWEHHETDRVEIKTATCEMRGVRYGNGPIVTLGYADKIDTIIIGEVT